MTFKPQKYLLLPLALFMALGQGVASAQTLRIGLAEDPDVLDPTLARSFVGRVVFASLCDKLFDIDEKLNILPQLASSYEWSADSKALTLKIRQGVTFHDGEKLTAEAKASLADKPDIEGPIQALLERRPACISATYSRATGSMRSSRASPRRSSSTG